MERIRVVDSHTGGEPTRVILEGQLSLAGATMAERRDYFRNHYDRYRTGVLCEPRGSDVLVGAVLTDPVETGSDVGVIFFNNVGYLGMCGHGTIGVVETLRFLDRVDVGRIKLDTPVGCVTAELHPSGEVSIQNVPSYLLAQDVPVEVPGVGRVEGDIAYGGNWFYIIHEPEYEISLARASELTTLTLRIMDALEAAGITGAEGAKIDHIELSGKPTLEAADSKNFVMCPGGAYDRSPCGTGTSAKLACLATRGLLSENQSYLQESVTGSVFRGSVIRAGSSWIPTITGRAHITASSELTFDPVDPIRWGLVP
ncbi:MAG: proline racemase family protein [Armatimonadetes bacterium]|nr:proline racemase family protein [Armatimonadota bacterium]